MGGALSCNIERADQLLSTGKRDEAITLYKKIVKECPIEFEEQVYRKLAECHDPRYNTTSSDAGFKLTLLLAISYYNRMKSSVITMLAMSRLHRQIFETIDSIQQYFDATHYTESRGLFIAALEQDEHAVWLDLLYSAGVTMTPILSNTIKSLVADGLIPIAVGLTKMINVIPKDKIISALELYSWYQTTDLFAVRSLALRLLGDHDVARDNALAALGSPSKYSSHLLQDLAQDRFEGRGCDKDANTAAHLHLCSIEPQLFHNGTRRYSSVEWIYEIRSSRPLMLREMFDCFDRYGITLDSYLSEHLSLKRAMSLPAPFVSDLIDPLHFFKDSHPEIIKLKQIKKAVLQSTAMPKDLMKMVLAYFPWSRNI